MFGVAGCQFKNTQPRTIDAAQSQFDSGSFKVGQTTKEAVRQKLGSPSEIKKRDNGQEVWIYRKNVEVSLLAVTTDVGTMYIAEYTFSSTGILSNTNYLATPMSNPLVM